MADFSVTLRGDPSEISQQRILDLDAYDPAHPVGVPLGFVWPNRAQVANPPSQSGAGLQPTLFFDGINDWVSFDGVDDHLIFSLAINAGVAEYDWALVYEPLNDNGAQEVILSAATGPLDLQHLDGALDQTGWDDGAAQQGVAAVASQQALYIVHDGPASATIARDGVVVGSGLTYTQRALGGAGDVVLGSDVGLTAPFAGLIARLLCWERHLPARQRHLVERSLVQRYGFSSPLEARAVPVNAAWTDPAFGGEPSRTNPTVGRPHRHWTGNTGWLQVCAVVGGVVGPDDSVLGGRLFQARVLEYPTHAEPGILVDAGWSAVVDVNCSMPGHYTIQLTREGGGSVIVHYDAE